jgi:hypothetical protein
MTLPGIDLSVIENNAAQIIERIEHEAVEVDTFLRELFERGPIENDKVFQFVFRSFYRLDNAGLTRDFKTRYFELMEQWRGHSEINLRELAGILREIPNLKGQRSLQFSFVTKLANTVSPQYPIYDADVARFFDFRSPDTGKQFEDRLNAYMKFYESLRSDYQKILRQNLLAGPRLLFRTKFSEQIPEIRVLDFIFWTAGKIGLRVARE